MVVNGQVCCECSMLCVVDFDVYVCSVGLIGSIGIVYMCWVIYGVLVICNVYLIFLCDEIVLVYNGIIENYEMLCK